MGKAFKTRLSVVSSVPRYLMVILAGVFLSPVAMAQDYSLCALTNKVALADGLKDYKDNQIQNGLCLMSKLAVQASSNRAVMDICLKATQQMMIEFKRRFPGKDTNSVIGRC